MKRGRKGRRLAYLIGGLLAGILAVWAWNVMFPDGNGPANEQLPVKRQVGFEPGVIPADAWPASWFTDPLTASEAGIETFAEAPSLAVRVERGELPEVRERLPSDPIVVEPYARIGRYGGRARTAGWSPFYFNQPERPLRICPEAATLRMNLAENLEVDDGGRIYTLHLRKGVRWSDGHPHTASDYLFWFEHVYMNEELTPVRTAPLDGAVVTKLDDYTVRFELAEPNAYFPNTLAHIGERYRMPRHFAVKYHPAFVDPDELARQARARGFVTWPGYFQAAMNGYHGRHVFDRPVLSAFRLVGRTHQRFHYERNPYYPKIDPEGNQLPYIDGFIRMTMSRELIVAQAAAGDLTIAGVELMTSDIPFLLRNERRGGYTTYLWNNYFGSDVVVSINQTFPVAEVRRVLSDVRFRRALSLAIDRDEINDILYFGQGVPRPMFVMPTSKFFDEQAAVRAFVNYDPREARRLLDEMGIVDLNGDGRRNLPGGKRLSLVVEMTDGVTPKRETMELVIEYWREIGLNIHLRQITGPLLAHRGGGNQMQMGVWHGDRVGDTLFPNEPMFFVPEAQGRETITWGQWVRWFRSGGEEGFEPPEEGQQLMEWWREMIASPARTRRIELGRKIMESQAENLWTIGIVGLTPKPLVVSDSLHNVPKRGYWGWDTKFNYPYHPETYFLDPP